MQENKNVLQYEEYKYEHKIGSNSNYSITILESEGWIGRVCVCSIGSMSHIRKSVDNA